MDTYFYDAPMETSELPLLKTVSYGVEASRYMPASEVKPSMWIKSNSPVKSNQDIFEVVTVTRRDFDGAWMIKVEGKSKGGVTIRTILTYATNEDVEVVE